jgi:hypothetical protein
VQWWAGYWGSRCGSGGRFSILFRYDGTDITQLASEPCDMIASPPGASVASVYRVLAVWQRQPVSVRQAGPLPCPAGANHGHPNFEWVSHGKKLQILQLGRSDLY